MKKTIGILLTIVSLVCIGLMAAALIGTEALGAGFQKAALPIVGALVTAYAAGKLFAAEETSAAQPKPAENRA